MLNLAGNAVDVVDNLAGLRSLTELNLRRNQIQRVLDLDALPALQRVFLSHNAIEDFDHIGCVFRSRSLSELALSHNPVSTTIKASTQSDSRGSSSDVQNAGEVKSSQADTAVSSQGGKSPVQAAEGKEGAAAGGSRSGVLRGDGTQIVAEADAQSERKREAEAEALQAYRYHVISSLPNLTHLDLQRISDSDRKTAEVMASRREDQKQHELRQKRARGQRDMAISRAGRPGTSVFDKGRRTECLSICATVRVTTRLLMRALCAKTTVIAARS